MKKSVRVKTFCTGENNFYEVFHCLIQGDWGSLTLQAQYPQTNSPELSPYTALKSKFGEFDKRSKHCTRGNHLFPATFFLDMY